MAQNGPKRCIFRIFQSHYLGSTIYVPIWQLPMYQKSTEFFWIHNSSSFPGMSQFWTVFDRNRTNLRYWYHLQFFLCSKALKLISNLHYFCFRLQFFTRFSLIIFPLPPYWWIGWFETLKTNSNHLWGLLTFWRSLLPQGYRWAWLGKEADDSLSGISLT